MNQTSFPRFYQIVDDAAWLERFLPLGLKLVQLRIKDKPQSFIRDQIQTSKTLCDQAGCQLVVNDYWREALDSGCDFIHLGQEDLQQADHHAIKDAGAKLGISTHDAAELTTALHVKPAYIALGPVYETILKQMKWAPQGAARVTEWKALIGDIPLVAIGGLTVERSQLIYNAGADSICVVTDVLLNNNPEARLSEWLNISTKTSLAR